MIVKCTSQIAVFTLLLFVVLPRQYTTTSNCPTSDTYRCTDGLVPTPPPVHVPCEGDDCKKGKLE